MRGRMVYVPPNLLEEVEKIQEYKGYKGKNARANSIREKMKYSRAALETEKLLKYDFNIFKVLRGK